MSKHTIGSYAVLLVLFGATFALGQSPPSSEREALEERAEIAFEELEETVSPKIGLKADPPAKSMNKTQPQPSEPGDTEVAQISLDEHQQAQVPIPSVGGSASVPSQQELYQRILAEEAAAREIERAEYEAEEAWSEAETPNVYYLNEKPTTVFVESVRPVPSRRRGYVRHQYGHWHFERRPQRTEIDRSRAHRAEKKRQRRKRARKQRKRMHKAKLRARRRQSRER